MSNSIPLLGAAALLVALAGCDAAGPAPTESAASKPGGLTVSAPTGAADLTAASALVYDALDFSDGVTEGSVTGRASSYDHYAYYQFCGEAGDVVSIRVRRLEAGLDPALDLLQGASTTTAGLPYGNPDLTYLVFRDDDVEDDLGGPFADPLLSDYTLPTTGAYTLAVYGIASSSDALYPYQIEATGLSPCVVDTDGDGVDDDVDAFPESDLRETVFVGAEDTGVGNQVLPTGATFNDLVGACAADAADHSAFVSCAEGLTLGWVADGLITDRDRGLIMRAAGRSDLP